MKKIIYIALPLLITCGLLVFISCNRTFDNTLENAITARDTVKKGYKILYVIMNGARGEAFGSSNRPVLRGMEENGVYTLNGLADYERKDSAFTSQNAWANMLTGVSQSKHLVKGNSFTGNAFAQYPSVISRIKSLKPEIRTAAFVSSASLKDNLLADAAVSQVLASDAEVQTATLAELKNAGAEVVIAEYSNIQNIGMQYGYDNNNSQYQAAILQMDTYIGALRDAIVARSDFSKENWLIVVASANGGLPATAPADVTAYGDGRRNAYILFYNPRFTTRLLEKPANSRGAGTYTGNRVRLYGNPSTAVGGTNVEVQNKAGETDQSALDIGNGPYTMEAKIKFNPKANSSTPYSYSNMPFLCKAQARSGSGTNSGWAFFRNGTNTTFWWRSDGATSGTRINTEFSTSTVINDGAWHSLGFTMTKSGNVYTATLYVDGLASGTSSLTVAAGDGITSPAPLRMGFNDASFSSDFIDMSIADVRIWKAALPANVIYQYSCLPGIPPTSHPYYNSLAGFWSGQNLQGLANDSLVVDETGNGRNAIIRTRQGGTRQWSSFSEVSNNICPAPGEAFFRRVPNTLDIPLQMLRWLGINTVTAPQVDGKIWLSSFDNL